MFPSTSSIVSVLFALALFSQDVDAGMSRRRHVPGRAGLHAYKARRAPAVMVRSVESDQSSLGECTILDAEFHLADDAI